MTKRALLIWAAAAAVRLIWAFGFGRVDTGWTEVQLIARSLLERGEFADPYAIPTGLTSHTAPVYPAIQALIFAVAGYGVEAEHVRIAFTILLASLEYALMPWLAVRLGLGEWAGLAAGWGGALVPLHYWGESMGVFENTLAALLLLVFTGLAGPQLRGEGALPTARAAVLGLFAGALILVSPTMLPPIVALAGIAMWRGGVSVGGAGAAAVCAVLVLGPWLVRNRVVFGGWSLVRGEAGLELNISNFDGASVDAMDNVGTAHFRRVHPFASREQCERIRQVGERQVYRERQEEAYGVDRRPQGGVCESGGKAVGAILGSLVAVLVAPGGAGSGPNSGCSGLDSWGANCSAAAIGATGLLADRTAGAYFDPVFASGVVGVVPVGRGGREMGA